MKRLEFIDVNQRRIVSGPKDRLMQISPAKYNTPLEILDKMQRDNWFAWDTPLVNDLAQFRSLEPKLQRAIQKALGFLSNLDGIQLGTLTESIARYCTAPEYKMALVRQAYEELVHVQTYDRMISTLEMDPIETYNLFMTDEMLRLKNEHIIRMAELLGTDYSDENYARAIAANQALEGIYFNMGFKLFYVVHRLGIMAGCAKNIRYINRDELNHLRLFNAMWRDLRAERPDLFTEEVLEDCREIMREAARYEIAWGKHIIEGGILGLTDPIVEAHVKHLANTYAQATDLGILFPEVTKDPLAWCDDYMREHGVNTNFFEDKDIAYEDAALEW